MEKQAADVTIRLTLLDNGVDFILKGIDELFDETNAILGYASALDVTTNRYKYGTLHLFSGFLLLLKERLSRHLPELIFRGKLSDVRKSKDPRSLHTIDLNEALERLEIGPKVTFSENEINVIFKMREYRNQFEHYEVSANKYQLWKSVSEFLDLVDRFLVRELQVNIEESATTKELIGKIQSIETAWTRIRQQRVDKWNEHTRSQLQKFRKARKRILKEQMAHCSIAKGDPPLFIFCPECYRETLIAHGDYQGICSNPECWSLCPITECAKCGNLTAGFKWEVNLCENCAEDLQRE